MTIFIKTVWIIANAVLFLAVIWFLLAATAFFNRGIDLVETVIFIFVWSPALVITVISWRCLKKGWLPKELNSQVLLLAMIITLTIVFSPILFNRGTPYGWLIPHVTRDWEQITSDGKFEYRMELVNLFQRNSRARLHFKNLATGEEITIPLDIQTRNIHSISISMPSQDEETRRWLLLSKMSSTDRQNIYILTTTARMRTGIEVFEINIETGTSRRIR